MQKTKCTWTPRLAAAVAALAWGVCVHIFGLVNVLHNYDDIYTQPLGYGTGITSGRWFLTILGNQFDKLFSNYNLPFFNGMVFILLLAFSAALLVDVFKFRRRWTAALCGMLFVSFPAATSVMFFKYTTIFYGIAILMSVAAVWVLPKGRLLGFVASGVLTALSLGIYQAYMPITVVFFVLALLQQALKEDLSFRQILLRGLYACGSIVLGLALYFLLLKASLIYYGEALSNYQGVNSMGSISIARLPELIVSAYKSFLMMPVRDYCDLAQLPLLRGGYLALGALNVYMIIRCIAKRGKKIGNVLMVVLLCAVFPLAANLIVIMCPDSDIYTLMVYSFVAVLWMPLVLLETLPDEGRAIGRFKGVLVKIVAAVVAVILLCYAYLANVNYVSLYYTNRQTENYLNGIVIQARMTEGFDAQKKWAFVGTIDDPLLRGSWQNVPIYGGNTRTTDLLSMYSWKNWAHVYMGYFVNTASEEEIQELQTREEFARMPCWPAEGSIQVIDDFIVFKFQETNS